MTSNAFTDDERANCFRPPVPKSLEIISSIGAALFFAGVVAWRFAPERDLLVQFGCAGVIVKGVEGDEIID